MSFEALSIYYWGAFLWSIVGFLVIGIPAIKEFIGIIRKKDDKEEG